MKRYTVYPVLACLCAILLTSCWSNKRNPGWEYMPDMAHSTAYDAYSSNPNFKDGTTNRVPVKGTVPLYQGVMGNASNFTPYPYANDSAGYAQAGTNLKNPLVATDPNVMAEGERLYVIYCSPCHGSSGKGDGSIVVNPNIKNPFPPPPSYFSENLLKLPEGKMFHVVQHGKNLMGSYASQVDQKQAWMIISHIKSMQQHYLDSIGTPGGYPKATRADSVASANATPVHNNAGVQSPSETPAKKK